MVTVNVFIQGQFYVVSTQFKNHLGPSTTGVDQLNMRGRICKDARLFFLIKYIDRHLKFV